MNNSAIIVGNGRGVLDKENGEIINGFDNVVRINQFRIKGYEKYVGTKTDFLVLNSQSFRFLYRPYNKKKDAQIGRFLKLMEKFNGNRPNDKNFKELFDIFLYNECIEETPDINKLKGIILRSEEEINAFKDKIIYIENDMNTNSTGYNAIKYFLKNNYQVTITGFDFFNKSSQYWLKTSELFNEEFLINFKTSFFKDHHDYLEESNTIKNLLNDNIIKML
jgi:hypothetical protein